MVRTGEILNQDIHTAQKLKFSIRVFFSKYDQIHRKLRIWPDLLKKSSMENLIFYAVTYSSTLTCSAIFPVFDLAFRFVYII